MRDKTIIIVGGGIGGLSAALALGQSGWNVRVLEQAPQFGAIGYGIQLGPNVPPMLARIGVRDQVIAASVLPNKVMMLDAFDGKPVTVVNTGPEFRARYGGNPYLVIHRVDLHNILVAACKAQPSIRRRHQGRKVRTNPRKAKVPRRNQSRARGRALTRVSSKVANATSDRMEKGVRRNRSERSRHGRAPTRPSTPPFVIAP